MFDVAAYEVLVESDGGDEVATSPEGLFLVQAMGAFGLLFEPGRRLPLHLHDVRDGVTRRAEKAKVNVVLLDIELDDFPMFPLADDLEDSSQFTFDLLCAEYIASVFWRPDKVIFQVVKTV